MPRPGVLLLWLVVLMFLDFCTTVVGLSVGMRELNPLVASLLRLAGLNGLVLSKILAMALGLYFVYSGRLTLLRRVNVLMAAVVGWNLLWLVSA